MKAINLRKLASNAGFDYVEVTNNEAACPEGIKGAVTGFSDFTQAEEFAKDYDLTLVKLVKRQDQDLYLIDGKPRGEYDLTDFIDESKYYSRDDFQYIKDFLAKKIDETYDFDELQEVMDDMSDLVFAINELNCEELVLKSTNEVIPRYVMGFDDDGKKHLIGAI